MTFTLEQIKQLENPYQDLGTGDALAEHREELNKLSPKEMQDLASCMILACPQEELDNFGGAINSLKSETEEQSNSESEEPLKNESEIQIKSESEEQSFHIVISQAHEVKKRVLGLLDPSHKSPYELLTDDGLFTPFKDLALKILEKNESVIAGRLALTTPEKSHSQLSRQINNTFNNSELATKIAAAFTLYRDINRFLLRDKPEEFFSSPEFNIDLCLEFSTLCSSLVKGHEQVIGEKLAQLDPTTRHDISRHLEMMCSNACDKQNPFRLIASVMAAAEEEEEEEEEEKQKQEIQAQTAKPVEVIPDTSNPHLLFNSQLRARKEVPEVTLRSGSGYDSESESDSDEEQESWLSSCCGLYKG